ncbi:hypothetical protein, partial [Caloramator quimbayensis]|uniref:hypothetical protein n=1 Tax=Caloramator quimbayensis TaxID=1147123 RepID=UPI001A9A34B1
ALAALWFLSNERRCNHNAAQIIFAAHFEALSLGKILSLEIFYLYILWVIIILLIVVWNTNRLR